MSYSALDFMSRCSAGAGSMAAASSPANSSHVSERGEQASGRQPDGVSDPPPGEMKGTSGRQRKNYMLHRYKPLEKDIEICSRCLTMKKLLKKRGLNVWYKTWRKVWSTDGGETWTDKPVECTGSPKLSRDDMIWYHHSYTGFD